MGKSTSLNLTNFFFKSSRVVVKVEKGFFAKYVCIMNKTIRMLSHDIISSTFHLNFLSLSGAIGIRRHEGEKALQPVFLKLLK